MEGVCCGWLVGCIIVELGFSLVSVGVVVGGCGAPWCRQPVGCRSRFDPCMPGWFGVGRPACGLFAVWSFSLQQFGWYMVVLAALRSACSSTGVSRCSPRRRSRMLSLLSSRLVLRFVGAGLFDVGVIVLRPRRAWPVVLVRRRRSSQWLACLGLCGCRYGPGRPRRVAVGCRLRCLFPFLARPRLRLLRCCMHYAWLVLLVGGRLCRLMVGLSCCWMCWAWWRVGFGSGCSGCVGPAGHALVVHHPPHGGVCFGGAWLSSWLGVSWGEKSFEHWYDMPCPALEPAYMHSPASCTSRCPSAFLSVSPVPVLCTPPLVTKPLRFAIRFGASPCSLWQPRGAVPALWCGVRALVRWPAALARSPGFQTRCVPCCAVLPVSGGVCVGASVRLPEVRVVWFGGTPAFSVAWRISGHPAVIAATSVL